MKTLADTKIWKASSSLSSFIFNFPSSSSVIFTEITLSFKLFLSSLA